MDIEDIVRKKAESKSGECLRDFNVLAPRDFTIGCPKRNLLVWQMRFRHTFSAVFARSLVSQQTMPHNTSIGNCDFYGRYYLANLCGADNHVGKCHVG